MRRLPDAEFFLPEPAKRRRRLDAYHRAFEDTRDLLVVAHAKCLDGIGSYLIHALAREHPPPVLYVHPNEVHEVLEAAASAKGAGRTLSINDLSFDRDHFGRLAKALRAAKEAGWTIVWRDHHHTQWEGVDTGALEDNLDVLRLDRRQEECGTSLAQQDLLPDDPLAKDLAAIVRDRDLWRNKDPRGARYEAAAQRLGTEAFVDRFLATRDVDASWIQAAADEAQRKTAEDVGAAVLSADVFGDAGEVGVIYGEIPKNVTLHALREQRGTRLELNLKPDGTFSVRSAKGTEVAHLLGQAYGGGGHPNAAGGKARVPFYEWPAYWARGGLSQAGMSVVRTALRLIREHDKQAATVGGAKSSQKAAAPASAGDGVAETSRASGKPEAKALAA